MKTSKFTVKRDLICSCCHRNLKDMRIYEQCLSTGGKKRWDYICPKCRNVVMTTSAKLKRFPKRKEKKKEM